MSRVDIKVWNRVTVDSVVLGRTAGYESSSEDVTGAEISRSVGDGESAVDTNVSTAALVDVDTEGVVAVAATLAVAVGVVSSRDDIDVVVRSVDRGRVKKGCLRMFLPFPAPGRVSGGPGGRKRHLLEAVSPPAWLSTSPLSFSSSRAATLFLRGPTLLPMPLRRRG